MLELTASSPLPLAPPHRLLLSTAAVLCCHVGQAVDDKSILTGSALLASINSMNLLSLVSPEWPPPTNCSQSGNDPGAVQEVGPLADGSAGGAGGRGRQWCLQHVVAVVGAQGGRLQQCMQALLHM